MKNLNSIILAICLSIACNRAICAQQYSAAAASSSSWVPEQNAPSATTIGADHPLAKIFPLKLNPLALLPGRLAQVSPDENYLFIYRGNQKYIYNVANHTVLIDNIPLGTIMNNTFNVMITANPIVQQGLFNITRYYDFHFFDLAARAANPEVLPFLSVRGYGFEFSPNGKYVAVHRKQGENAVIVSVYAVEPRRPIHPDHDELFHFYGGGKLSYRYDSTSVTLTNNEGSITHQLDASPKDAEAMATNHPHLDEQKALAKLIVFEGVFLQFLLNTQYLISQCGNQLALYNTSFMRDPAFLDIVKGKLTLSQLTLVALLNKYYGNPISFHAIAAAENNRSLAEVLRHVLQTFPKIIKQSIIKTYNITDAHINLEA